MTDRERWIVYPLIFLALGVALRDKITRTLESVELIGGETMQIDLKRGIVAGEATRAQIDFAGGQIQAETIRCKKLVVEQEIHTNQIVSQRAAAQEIVVVSPDGAIRILLESLPKPNSNLAGSDQVGGRLIVFGPEGKAQVLLAPGTAGGEVAVVDKSLRLRLNFGGFEGGVMLAAETAGHEKIPFLTLPAALDPTANREEEPVKEPAETNSETTSPGPPEPTEE